MLIGSPGLVDKGLGANGRVLYARQRAGVEGGFPDVYKLNRGVRGTDRQLTWCRDAACRLVPLLLPAGGGFGSGDEATYQLPRLVGRESAGSVAIDAVLYRDLHQVCFPCKHFSAVAVGRIFLSSSRAAGGGVCWAES